MAEWLSLCSRSILDQDGATAEHIVQDGGSTDSSQWSLTKCRKDFPQANVVYHPEVDSGMYDAVNKGLKRATGNILSYLNCDEQYLPGALEAVDNYFTKNPTVDVVAGDVVVVNSDGEFLSYRKAILPVYREVLAHTTPILTCATFFRRSLLDKHQLFFEPRFKTVGDRMWLLALLKEGIKVEILRRFTSIFTMTGNNLDHSGQAKKEKAICRSSPPAIVRSLRGYYKTKVRLRRLARGGYFQKPFEYSLYTQDSQTKRMTMFAASPTSRWPQE